MKYIIRNWRTNPMNDMCIFNIEVASYIHSRTRVVSMYTCVCTMANYYNDNTI